MALDESYTIALCVEKGWAARLWCDCGHEVLWGPERLQSFPASLTIQALANSAECRLCKTVGAKVHLRQASIPRPTKKPPG